MLAEVLEDQLVLNRTLPRTLAALLFKPGKLTEEYVRGRIVSYIAPFRLYLVSSVVFFLMMSFVGLGRLESVTMKLDEAEAAADSASIAADSAAALADSIAASVVPDGMARPDSMAAASAIQESAEDPSRVTPVAQDSAGVPQDSADAPDPPLDTGEPLPFGQRQRWAQNINFEGSSGFLMPALERKIGQIGHLPVRDAIRQILRDLLEYAPHMIFLLLPFYALLLKLMYFRRDRYYAEHFVFALHVHAFLFLNFTLMLLLPDQVDIVLLLWTLVYFWVAMKRVYKQGWFRTTIKYWTLFWSYSFFLLFGLIGLAIATLLLT